MVSISGDDSFNQGRGIKTRELVKTLQGIGRRLAATDKIPNALELVGVAAALVGAYQSGDKTRMARVRHMVLSIKNEP